MSDTINRQDAIDRINKQREHLRPDVFPQDAIGDAAYRVCAEFIERLPSAESEEFEWCHDCKEYDQEAHCCHRWTKVIRNTVKELKTERTGHWIDTGSGQECSVCREIQYGYDTGRHFCSNCGARMVGGEEE